MTVAQLWNTLSAFALLIGVAFVLLSMLMGIMGPPKV